MEFKCIVCDDRVNIEGDEVVFMVWKEGRKYYACSQNHAEKARDEPDL